RAVQILKDMLAEGDLGGLLVGHAMEGGFKLADNITVLHRGRVIAAGSPAPVPGNAQARSAYLGGADGCCGSGLCTPITAGPRGCRAGSWRCGRDAWPPCSAATGSASPRRYARSSGSPRRAAATC